MNENMSIASIKGKAKNQLLGNYRTASGAFVLMLAIVYAISSILLSSYTSNMSMLNGGKIADVAANVVSNKSLFFEVILSNVISIVVNIFSDLLQVGFVYIILGISNNKNMKISDLFYCFKNHPDRVIIMSVIFSVVRLVVMLPSSVISDFTPDFEVFSLSATNYKWMILMVIGNILYFLFYLNCALCYLVYLRDENKTGLECIKESIRLMKGNKIKLFRMILSFVGYYILGVLSFGIGFMYILPLLEMAMVYFYKDIAGEEIIDRSPVVQEEINYWK